SGVVAFGGNWTWIMRVTNSGAGSAFFTNGSTVFLDALPANIQYGTPTVSPVSGLTGTLAPAIDGSKNLTVTASSAVSPAPGGAFNVQVTATPTIAGVFGNPRQNGVCTVDPNNSVPETSKANNSALNSVTVTCPTITANVSGDTNICPNGSAMI